MTSRSTAREAGVLIVPSVSAAPVLSFLAAAASLAKSSCGTCGLAIWHESATSIVICGTFCRFERTMCSPSYAPSGLDLKSATSTLRATGLEDASSCTHRCSCVGELHTHAIGTVTPTAVSYDSAPCQLEFARA